MDEQQAVLQARKWWGRRGSAKYIPYRSFLGTPLRGRFVVGLTFAPDSPGRIYEQLGTSRLSFEAAFEDALESERGPLQGQEGGTDDLRNGALTVDVDE